MTARSKRRAAGVFALLFVVLFPQLQVMANSSQELKKADDLILENKLQEAVNILTPLANDKKYILSDYARLRLAEAFYIGGNTEQAQKEYALLIEEHPESILAGYREETKSSWAPYKDAGEKAWAKGFALYKKKKYAQAVSVFSQAESLYPVRDSGPKCLFWQAKSAEKLGRSKDALELYRRASQRYPYTYYGYRALAKLREKPASFELRSQEGAQNLPDNIHMKKFKELFDAGFYKEAAEEAAAAERIEEDPAKKRAAGVCVARAAAAGRDWKRAIRAVEIQVLDCIYSGSLDEVDKESWLLSFPRGYEKEVYSFAEKHGVDPYLMFALIREESRFNSKGLSRAFARGLTQIIPRTGKLIAKALNIDPYHTLRLFEPELNVEMGAYYLSQMLKLYSGNEYLALAAYNGGSGSVKKWLKRTGASDIDEFVENIGFSETRAYVKKVMRSYWEYKRLYRDVQRPEEQSLSAS
ncbi:MAG: transglycosylase SLT domain-containing protein [Candidatus Margulisiibacteriota bacterium]